MKTLYLLVTSILLIGATISGAGPAPEPAPDKTQSSGRAVVERIIDAHGGMDPWENAEVVQFTHVSFMPSMPDHFPRWMISHETVEKRTGRAYADHPHWNAEIVYDGNEVWSRNWQFPNPPEQMIGIHYYMVFLPWLSQDDSIVFSDATSATLPGRDGEVTSVSFWYETESNDKPDIWTLYADPESGEMAGFGLEFAQGKATHVLRRFTDAGGLKVPSDWTTYIEPEQRIIGHHSVVDAQLNAAFDESRMHKPNDDN